MNKMVDRFENMNRRTRLVLSVLGISAVVIPALLLLVLSKNVKQEPKITTSKRIIDTSGVENSVRNLPAPSMRPSPTLKAATNSASPNKIITPK